MIKDRRKTFQLGGSRAITLPSGIETGTESTMAADRLLILDPLGEIPEDVLLEFLTEQIQPLFWSWWEARQQRQAGAGSRNVSALGKETLAPVKTVKASKAQCVATPNPNVPLVTCSRCGQLIAWTIDPALVAVCPRCRGLLRLWVKDFHTVRQFGSESIR